MGKTVQSSVAKEAQLFKALGDEIRLKMIGLLSTGELCVCDIMEVLRLPQSTTSRHLAYLKNSHWITGRRSGKWMHYRINPTLEGSSLYQAIINHISDLEELRSDQKHLKIYLKEKNPQKKCA